MSQIAEGRGGVVEKRGLTAVIRAFVHVCVAVFVPHTVVKFGTQRILSPRALTCVPFVVDLFLVHVFDRPLIASYFIIMVCYFPPFASCFFFNCSWDWANIPLVLPVAAFLVLVQFNVEGCGKSKSHHPPEVFSFDTERAFDNV